MPRSVSFRFRPVLAAALLFPAVCGAEPLDDQTRQQEQLGDALLLGVPLAALALTFWLDERDGGSEQDGGTAGAVNFDTHTLTRLNGSPRHDLALAMGRTLAVTYGLKYSVDEERPNGDPHSFPSAHSAITFAGAEFMRKEYGWSWGLPAYLAAGFVGYSRVRADEHYAHDVLAGAAIGILSNYDFPQLRIPFGGGEDAPVGTVGLAPLQAAPPVFQELRFGSDEQAPVPGLRFSLRF